VHYDANANPVTHVVTFETPIIVNQTVTSGHRQRTFNETPGSTGVKGTRYSSTTNGKLLLTIGKAGVAAAETDTSSTAACTQAPDGSIVFADGHWPRLKQSPGRRPGWFSTRATVSFVNRSVSQDRSRRIHRSHALAYDSQGPPFVADRSNNRVQIFDKDMKFVDEWRHFGRPAGCDS